MWFIGSSILKQQGANPAANDLRDLSGVISLAGGLLIQAELHFE